MQDLGLQQFNQIFPMLIKKYNNLIIDQNASERDKINQIINKLNALGKLSNDVVKNWNVVYNWTMNDGLTTDVSNKIETMKANGELTTVLQGVFNALTGDMTTLHTNAKDTLVNSINEVDDLAKSNQTKMGDLTTLQTADKDTIVHAINDNVASLAQKATQTDLNTTNANVSNNAKQLTDIAINAKYPPVPQVGCVGDGVADDTTTLNNIIANAPVGATIILGNHYCAGKITGSKRLNFAGQNFMNANSSAASLSGIKFANLAVCIDWTGNVSFEKLIIQGVGKTVSTGIGIQVYNGSLALEKTTIQNFNTGVHVTYGYYNKYNNSYIGYCMNGIVHDNCYNSNAVGLSVIADTTPVQLNNNSHMRFHGGTIEGFQGVGINLTQNSVADLFGTYFEGGGTLAGYGVQLANGCQVNAIGCQVYMTSMAAFISSADVANTTGISIFSRNNKMTYPTTAFNCIVYKFKLNDPTSYIDIAGDIWNTSAGSGVYYIDSSTFANQLAQNGNYSIILPSNHPDSGSKDIYTKNHIVAKTKVTPATPMDGEFLFFLNNGFGTDDPLGIHGVYGYHSYRAVYQNGQWEKVGARIPQQANSVATDVPTLVSDFNALLTKLRNNGIMI